jgi:AraC family transcriptional regulator
MNYLAVIEDAVHYIEEHLDENVRLEELAARYYLSPNHFYRIFRAVMNRSVNAYVETRRLTVAAEQIRTTQKKIVDIALECGYSSHQAFTRSFTRWSGATPAQVRKNEMKLPVYFPRPELIKRHFKNVNKDVIVDFNVTFIDDLRLGGREISFDPYSEEEIKRVRQSVKSFTENWAEHSKEAKLFNVIRNNSLYPKEQIAYFMGFQLPLQYEDCGQLKTYKLPPSNYAVFQYDKSMDQVFQTAINDAYRSIAVSNLSLNECEFDFFEVYDMDYEVTGCFKLFVPVILL